MRRSNCVISNFVCPECKRVIQLPRQHGRQRKKNHIKDIYCPYCKEIRKFQEVTYKCSFETEDGKIIYS